MILKYALIAATLSANISFVKKMETRESNEVFSSNYFQTLLVSSKP